ncbi:MAG TPA: metallophosphoesterase, partial [Armatimonadaceae bacterium]|nr:metallophosphoesterase [Armatimonadaceae bacterium]
ALVSDPHVTRGQKDDQPLHRGRFDGVIAAVNAAGVELVLIAGDLTEGGKPEEFDDFAAQVRGFRAPVRFVPGNHDVGPKRLAGKPGGVTGERVERYEKRLGRSFWAETLAGVRVIGVNSPLMGSGLPAEAAQWAFLEREMRPAPGGGVPTLLLTHYPPFLAAPDEAGGDYWNIEPEPRERLLGLIERAGVRAVLSGHLHRPLETRSGGVLYHTTPPVSFGLPRGKQPQGWTLVTVTKGAAGAKAEIRAEFRAVPDGPLPAPPSLKETKP